MTTAKEEQLFRMYKRRAWAMRSAYNMYWTNRQTLAFVKRLVKASAVEGIDDRDLRVLVRMYNREIQDD
jgi:hypothetical protein